MRASTKREALAWGRATVLLLVIAATATACVMAGISTL